MEIRRLASILVPIVWLVILVVALLMWTITKDTIWPFSYVLGAITSLMMFNLQVKQSYKIIKNEDNKPRRTSYYGYAFRLFFQVLILVIAFVLDTLEVIPCFLGLLTLKLCLIIVMIVRKGKME